MYLSQYTADLASLDHQEAVRRLQKTNFRPTDKSDIQFMKEKFKKRWDTATQKLSITHQASGSKKSDPSSDIATKEKADDKTTSL